MTEQGRGVLAGWLAGSEAHVFGRGSCNNEHFEHLVGDMSLLAQFLALENSTFLHTDNGVVLYPT